MCGIVGYIGSKNSVPILIEGLKKLEYRGYDSAGIAFFDNGKINIMREVGNLSHLEAAVNKDKPCGSLGIGHTRWATHGRPTKENAHPHEDCKNKIFLVHNGIIENFLDIKKQLTEKGHIFHSETDTEVIVHLIEEHYKKDLFEAVQKAVKKLEGSFAIAVICQDHPNLIVVARKDSPLIIGVGNNEYFVASDIPAVLNHTKNIFILEDYEMAKVTPEGVYMATFDGKEIKKEIFKVKWDEEAAEKGGFEDFMLKEIFEQPKAIRETTRDKLNKTGEIFFDDLQFNKEELLKINKVVIIACGTSYHAGLVGKAAIEHWAKIPVEVDISSEFRYSDLILNENTLVIAITQSGETADTLAGVREAKSKKAKVIGITNVLGSTITREADGVVYTHAGPEIGVAATKTLVSQMVALYIFALYLARIHKCLDEKEASAIIKDILLLPDKVEEILSGNGKIKEVAENYADCADFLFLGRGVGLPVALEGALKLKEISYIHAEGYAAGEMKHGPIALIDDGVPVVVVATKSKVYEKILGNIQEVKARGADIIAVASRGDGEIKKVVDHVFYVAEAPEIISAILAVVPLQLLAYHMAKVRGCNVDQPRNLAKSVTVE
ncbi:glutamine--fructose-6-phosphate transaminase (isomerizing) [Candidatus Oleimmundimicrobium sp.]|uniref:glutamine--fructose-6-phosphate transaminase (isomerizing) n=1 Tax=Candidatus Oleimmundimicrobium sp. TaxID=3060597 RepID=UPI0027230086|nr:glutamine--fructose-6-phosphate transaminase (isomerizing) [Candidatus Oleimmundimicrobium sp.]MDO8886024.1 glutamine--fructose-6-phosphate transaminase (isomerizing) [Candidatus Oleimmundimicrobium sp.]